MTFIDYLGQQHLSGDTIHTYSKYQAEFTAWLSEEALSGETFTYSDLLDYMRHLKVTGRSVGTVRSIVNVIRHYGHFLIAEGARQDNPAAGLYIRGFIRKLPTNLVTMEELAEVYHQYSLQLSVDLGKKAMLGLLVYQGLTVTELIRLEARHIWIKEQKVLIKAGRQSAERVLPLDAAQVIILDAYLREHKRKGGPLFMRQTKDIIGKRNTGNRIKHMISQARKLNSRILSAVQIRSSVITHWLKDHHLREVQYMAGHKYVSSTEYYQLNHLDDLQSEVNRHHPMR
jgi:site-specific recombinase XerD